MTSQLLGGAECQAKLISPSAESQTIKMNIQVNSRESEDIWKHLKPVCFLLATWEILFWF